jgi:hypothetical protein
MGGSRMATVLRHHHRESPVPCVAVFGGGEEEIEMADDGRTTAKPHFVSRTMPLI